MENKVVLKLWWRPIHTFWCMGKYNMKRGKGFFLGFFPPLPLVFVSAPGEAHEAQLLYSQDDFK